MVPLGAPYRVATGGIAALLVFSLALGGAEPDLKTKRDLDLHVVVLEASGRAAKPDFDPGAPAEIRKQLENLNLAYGKYTLISNERRPARFGTEVPFDLPDKESLVIKPAADAERPSILRLGCRVLDASHKPILISPMRVCYDKTFFLQRLKGANGILMGVSALRPSDDARK